MSEQESLLKTVTDFLGEESIDYMLCWGTLLQLYRDGEFKKNDDVDLAVFENFWMDKDWPSLVKKLFLKGYEIKDAAYNYLCIVPKGKTEPHCDLHLLEQSVLDFSCTVTGIQYNFPSDYFLGTKRELHYKNKYYRVPCKTEEFLEFLYGENWEQKQDTDYFVNCEKINNHNKFSYPFWINLEK